MKLMLAFLCLIATYSAAHAEKAAFAFLKTVTVGELNAILTDELGDFLQSASRGEGYEAPAPSTASNDVDIYVVRYHSHRPDLRGDERRPVSGLLALPRLANRSSFPLISYQHGTVWGTYEVPSYAFKTNNPAGYPHYAHAYETRHIVALYAGNGYAVMAADYFGMGDDTGSNEAYMMKQSTAQANYDLYLEVRDFLASRGVDVSKLLLGGWSQGGLNTTGFLELLEHRGVPVSAAFTAAAPSDPFAALNAALFHPSSADAPWINAILALTIFSCENYMGPEGLAKATVAPEYLDGFKGIYDRKSYPAGLNRLLEAWAGTANLTYLRPELHDPAHFAASDYGRCLASNETYRRQFKTPIRMFYGSNDEVIRVRIGRLAAEYQETLVDTPGKPSANRVTPILVKGADHRLTFINAAAAAKTWIDTLP